MPRPHDRKRLRAVQGRALVSAALLALTGALALPALAGATVTPAPGTATFNGQPINLAAGWGGAHACLVKAPSDVQCFATPAEMNAAIAASNTSAAAASPTTACGGGALYLYKGSYFSGNELAIESYGFWVNLSDYGFAGALGSWDNATSCEAYVATGTYGSGSLLPMSSYDFSYTVSSPWSTTTNSAYIA